MSDLISRQAAIDAVAESLKRTFVEYRDVAEKIISKVPSAQPDVPDTNVGDMISRQAAIDAIVKQSVVDKTVAKRVLTQLPSAEPELKEQMAYSDGYYDGWVKGRKDAESEIIRCKDCKHRPIDTGKDNNSEDFEFPDDICPCVCADYFYSWMPDDDWFCANGERMDAVQKWNRRENERH